jgi:hypothetical protein
MDQHQAHLKSNYHKLADRNYRSGGSGSTSGGGASMDKMQYNKAQFYPKKKLNVSDMTEQENLMHEDKESVFYSAQVYLYFNYSQPSNTSMHVSRRHTGNRNSRDQQFVNIGMFYITTYL